MQKKKVGIIGCGSISGIYLKNLTGTTDSVTVVACADVVSERARARAGEYGIKALSVRNFWQTRRWI